MPAVSSAAGLLTFLDDDNDELKQYALVNLDKVVDQFWYQISGSIASVEALYEDEEFQDRELAALIASKVFYYLGELDSALTYALGAGARFDVNEPSEYVQTLVARCLDHYFEQRVRLVEGGEEVTIDPRLEAVVERMIDTCCSQGQQEQAVGVALEARRLDKLEAIVGSAPDPAAVLPYALKVAQRQLVSRSFREKVLRLLLRLYEAVPAPDWLDICQALMLLGDAPQVAQILLRLVQGGEDDVLLAYQVAFDLAENELQSFLQQVLDLLPSPQPAPAAAPDAVANGDAAPAAMDTDAAAPAAPPAAEPAAAAATAANGGPALPAGLEAGPGAERLERLRDILSGKTPVALTLEFLYHHNKADLQVLKSIKGSVDARLSVCHSAAILANALMHAGTSVDTFLRDNLEWLSRATNWAKFSATAGLGVIHRGQLTQGRALMAPYLPRDGNNGSPYSEGGALYALGLISANHGAEQRAFLLASLRSASNPIIQHGACLGLGLAALGTSDSEVFEDLKNVLYTDDAVAGEAAGLGMGLLCCGSGSEHAVEMLAYAHDTQHEKIIRGLAVGLALVNYGREEAADALVEQMARDQDPILRYGAMFVIGLAYRGTGNNAAVQRLLHFAVSDVSDDVRRAAVLCLGFVLMSAPEQVPRIVSLLAQSFNPHVRYGAAMAMGIACAGSGQRDAAVMLEGMLSDPTDFVRQGAAISLALVLLQQPEARVEPLRRRLAAAIADKHEEVLARMGAIVAAGILDAGGRNATVGLRSRSGFFRRTSVVGLAVFCQHWYWHPLSYCLSLALAPTALIGLDATLRPPRLELLCAARPNLFAYPAAAAQEANKEVAKVEKAVLSTTAKARERAKKKEQEKRDKDGSGPAAMDTDDKPGTAQADAKAGAAGSGAAAGEGSAGGEAKAEAKAKGDKEEPASFMIEAPCRVVPQQAKFVSFPPGSRWAPVKRGAPLIGITMLRDTQPGEPVAYAASSSSAGGSAGGAGAAVPAAAVAAQPPAAAGAGGQQEQEPPPPEPFEYVRE